MPRKPKGWYHRYEIKRVERNFTEMGIPGHVRPWWYISQFYGRKGGAGGRWLELSDPGENVSDESLMRRAGVHDVTVPVYVIRDGQATEYLPTEYK